MSTVVSGIRVTSRVTEGDVRVTSGGGELMVIGVIAGALTGEKGCSGYVLGRMVDDFVMEPGVWARVPGMCMGDVNNHGGDLTINGEVKEPCPDC